MSDKLLELIWSLDVETINDHLPTERKSLKQLLTEEKPHVKTKKNKNHFIRKKDLELAAKILPQEEWGNIRLPIILLRRTQLDKGLFSVSGGICELFLIATITDRTKEDFESFKMNDHQPYIWKPEAFAAIRKMSSLIIIGYT
ncbi:MAG: DUF61 family protein [Candidatus Heimdallarchaeota archaeon]|nr:DUF61 family protein [Candidatus Heimdallarchaeota archaeon]